MHLTPDLRITYNCHKSSRRSKRLTIDIAPQLESQLRTEATKQGLNASDYVINTLQEHLRQTQNDGTSHLTETESRLLQQINVGLPQETWAHYNALINKRRAETLTPDEQATLIEISDRIEQLNVNRLFAAGLTTDPHAAT